MMPCGAMTTQPVDTEWRPLEWKKTPTWRPNCFFFDNIKILPALK